MPVVNIFVAILSVSNSSYKVSRYDFAATLCLCRMPIIFYVRTAVSVHFAATSCLYPFLPLYMKSRGLRLGEAAIILSLTPVFSVAGTCLASKVAVRASNVKVSQRQHVARAASTRLQADARACRATTAASSCSLTSRAADITAKNRLAPCDFGLLHLLLASPLACSRLC